MIMALCQFSVGLGTSFFQCWQLTVVLLSAIPLIAGAGFVMIKAFTDAHGDAGDQYAGAGGLAAEQLAAVRTVAALNGQPEAIARYRKFITRAMHVGVGKSFKVGVGSGLLYLSIFFSNALGFWYGAKLIADQTDAHCTVDCLSGGKVMTVFFCTIIGSMALGQVAPPVGAVFSAAAAAADVFKVIDRVPLIDGLSDAGLKPAGRPTGALELRGVNFAYPSRPNITVCRDYTLAVKRGESLALCGPSGAGKSTIMALLLRFYDPQSGAVTLDGNDVRDLNVRWLRHAMGYVGQEPVLFAGTVAENIAYGLDSSVEGELDPSALQARIEAAAREANAHDFITSFPKGYQTDVGTQGSAMSGGQKQRIAIARALIKRPSVLLLDEATSALDAASEKIVQASIDSLAASKTQTTLIIAHRLSTIRNCDRIAVVNQGRVVELGSHDELYALNGMYTSLVDMQMGGGHAVDTSAAAGSKAKEEDTATKDESAGAYTPYGKTPQQQPSEQQPSKSTPNKAEVPPPIALPTGSEKNFLRKRIWERITPHMHWLVAGFLGAAMCGVTFPIWGLVRPPPLPFTKTFCSALCSPSLTNQFTQKIYSSTTTPHQLLANVQNIFFYKNTQLMRDEAANNSLYFVALGGLALFGFIIQNYCLAQVGEQVTTILRSDLFESILRRETAYFDDEKNSTGSLTARLADDPRLVHEATGETFAAQLQATCTLFIGLFIGFSATWKVSLVVLACFPVSVVAGMLRSRRHMTGGSESAQNDGKVRKGKRGRGRAPSAQTVPGKVSDGGPSGIIAAAFTHMRTISAFSMQHAVGKQYCEMTEANSVKRRQGAVLSGFL